MRVWYDCEFLEDGSTIELISIGMVAEDGRELYAINADMQWARIVGDEWLATNVVPHLPTTTPLQYRDGLPPHGRLDLDHPDVRTHSQIARAVRDFLADTPSVELWAWFGAYDHVALAQLFGRMVDLPAAVPMWTNDVRQEMHRLGNPRMPAQSGAEHNALADARHVKAMHEALLTAEVG